MFVYTSMTGEHLSGFGNSHHHQQSPKTKTREQAGMQKTIIIGVDFSITSPSITILTYAHNNTQTQTYSTIVILLRVDSILIAQTRKQCLDDSVRLKYDGLDWNLHLLEYEDEKGKEKIAELRYQKITEKLFDCLTSIIGKEINKENIHLAIEDYSFSANGRITDIAECTSVFKQKCYTYFNKPCTPIAPTTIKKHYSGKGNANKVMMYKALLEHTNQNDIKNKIKNIKDFDMMNPKCKIPAPLNDMVDSLACAFTYKEIFSKNNYL